MSASATCFGYQQARRAPLLSAQRNEITVLIADEHPIFRKGLRKIITAEPSLKLVAEVEDGSRALEAIRSQLPQVAVLDVDMPRQDGITVARTIKEEDLCVAVVLLTMHRNERFFNAALDLGVAGYVLKDSAASEIVSAIRAVSAGHRFVTPLLTDYLLSRRQAQTQSEVGTGLSTLTDAERRVMKFLLGVQEQGDYSFYVNVEALPATPGAASPLEGGNALKNAASGKQQ